MKKINLALTFLGLLGATGLTGCSKRADVIWWNNYKTPTQSELEAAEKDEAEKAKLRTKYAEYYYAKDVIAEFTKANPDITVETEYKGGYGEIATAVNANLGTGNTPNIVSAYQDNAFAFNQTQGAVLDMTEYAKELENDSDFNQAQLAIEKKIYGGKLLSLPYSKSAEMLVVNQSAFEKVGAGAAGVTVKTGSNTYTAPVAVESKEAYAIPTTWDEMIATARKIKQDFPSLFEEQKDAEGYFKALPICWDSTENMAISFLENAGITYTNASAAADKDMVPVFDDAEAKKLFIQLKKWNNEGLLGTQNQLPMSGKYHIYGSEMFYTGRSFMNISSTAGSTYFAADGFRATITKNPSYNGNSKVISQGPSLVFLDKGKESNDKAFKFYKFLTAKENGAKLTAIDAYFPLRSSTYEEASVKAFTDKADETLAADTEVNTTAAKRTAYVGKALNLNKTYTANNSYFISDVFKYSSKARTAIGKLTNDLFNDKGAQTDEQIAALVNTLFDKAKKETYAA